jgi:serine/threonine protein kinase
VPELDAFLTGASDDRRVAAHLEACDHCRRSAEEIRADNELLSRVASLGDGPRTAAPEGGGIPGYEILEEIERGGQGIVYRAVQAATRREVAVKVLLRGALATSRQRRRFEREVELVAGLDHPGIITVHDSGRTADDRYWLAMQLVHGSTLDAWLEHRRADGPPDQASLLRLFEQIVAAVSHAHQHGVIHRDLKPGNVIVDADGRPHVLDFGLARAADGDGPLARSRVTEAGQFLGTLAYAAPEQVRGDDRRIDVRSDVYALGVILYELVTGRSPVPDTGDLSEVVRAICDQAPPRPGAVPRERGVARGRVDDDLETLILTALAKEPARRYQSAAALAADVRHYLAGEPIDAKGDSGWYVLRKTLRRYRWRVSIAAAFVAVLAVSSAMLAVLYQRARVETRKARQTVLFLEDTLGSAGPGAAGELTVRELVDEAVQWIDIALGDEPEVAASLRSTMGNSYRSLGRHADAEEQIRLALATRRGLFGDEHLQVAQSINLLAILRRDQGELAEAERLFRESLAMRRRLGGDGHAVSINLANLGLVRRDLGDFDEAERLLRESMAIRRGLFGAEHSDVAMCLFNLGTVRLAAGDRAGAERLHREALAMRRRVLHPHHPDLVRSLEQLAPLVDDDEAARLRAEARALQADRGS